MCGCSNPLFLPAVPESGRLPPFPGAHGLRKLLIEQRFVVLMARCIAPFFRLDVNGVLPRKVKELKQSEECRFGSNADRIKKWRDEKHRTMAIVSLLAAARLELSLRVVSFIRFVIATWIRPIFWNWLIACRRTIPKSMKTNQWLLALFACLGIGIGLCINVQESKVRPHEAQKISPVESDTSNGVFVGNPRELSQRWDLVTDQDKPQPYIFESAVERTWFGLGIVFGTILFSALAYAGLFGKGNNAGLTSEQTSSALRSTLQSSVIRCPHCMHQLRIPSQHQAERLRCPACKYVFNSPSG
jgi:hypothetical protein